MRTVYSIRRKQTDRLQTDRAWYSYTLGKFSWCVGGNYYAGVQSAARVERTKKRETYKPSQKLVVSSIPVGSTFFVEKKKKEEASPQGKNRAMGRGS